MTNKGKPNNRSNKRHGRLPSRYNDHVMSNLSQNKSTSEQIKNSDEIRVREGDNNGVIDEFKKEKLGEASGDCEKNSVKDCGLNDKNHKDLDGLNEPEECLDSVQECLDNSEKKDIEGLESNTVNDHSAKTNFVDLSKSPEKTYASATKSTSYFETKKLLFVPTKLNEIGEEVVVFDEELIELGSKKIGIEFVCNERGMITVANQSPWMINSKHLMVYKWDRSVGIKKTKPKKVPVWIKLFEVPMKAWTTKEISAISSSMGRRMIMDSMIAYVCKNGVGRTEFVRVLVEVDADKGFKEAIELQYRDKQHKVKGTKTVRVVYDWKPSICSHCVVFGHDHKSYKVRIRTKEEITKDKADANLNINKENGFVQSKGRKPPPPPKKMNSYLNRPGSYRPSNNKFVDKAKPY
ncbi:RNA-directed DNA polymerase, eukaryota, reverse transcriptase zinc-binding domain protein [Tanacetum coccineum]